MRITNQHDFGRMDEIISKHSEAQTGCPVNYTYTLDDSRMLLDGFRIEEIYKAHIFPYKIDLDKKHQYELEDCFKNMEKHSFEQMEKELGWHTLIKAIKE